MIQLPNRFPRTQREAGWSPKSLWKEDENIGHTYTLVIVGIGVLASWIFFVLVLI